MEIDPQKKENSLNGQDVSEKENLGLPVRLEAP